MSRAKEPASWRELRVELRRLGALPVRVTGSHEMWRFHDGAAFVVVRNHLNDAVPVGILVKFRRVRGRRRAAVGEEPVLPGRAGPRWLRPARVTRKEDGPWAKEAAEAAEAARAALERRAAEAAARRVARAARRAARGKAGTGRARLGSRRAAVGATRRRPSR